MRINEKVDIPLKRIAAFCSKWHISELALFGSVLGPDFGPRSDIDVLVTFEPDSRHNLFDLVQMEDELRAIFGRDVDLIDRKSVEASRNYIRRREVLGSMETVYVA